MCQVISKLCTYGAWNVERGKWNKTDNYELLTMNCEL